MTPSEANQASRRAAKSWLATYAAHPSLDTKPAQRRRRLRMEKLEDRRVLSASPLFSKDFSPSTIGVGSVSTLTLEISNPEQHVTTDLAFVDNLPSGVVIATPAIASTTCGGTLTAPDGGSTISLTDGAVGAGVSCSVSVDVTSSVPGTHTNVSGDLTSSAGNSGSATADLTVSTSIPGFSKSFSPSSVNLGSRSRLTFTIDNANDETASTVSELTFTDQLPPGMVIADPPGATISGCTGGILTADAGADMISLWSGFRGGRLAQRPR